MSLFCHSLEKKFQSTRFWKEKKKRSIGKRFRKVEKPNQLGVVVVAGVVVVGVGVVVERFFFSYYYYFEGQKSFFFFPFIHFLTFLS